MERITFRMTSGEDITLMQGDMLNDVPIERLNKDDVLYDYASRRTWLELYIHNPPASMDEYLYLINTDHIVCIEMC